MTYTAVQMIGTQRSGSNLLRLMLNQLSEVSAPHPPHILERFMPLLPLYGDSSRMDNFRKLTTDICSLIRSNPVAWTNVSLDENTLMSQCKDYTLPELAKVIYEHKAKEDDARIWICKSMANIHYADELEATLQPLYIFLYRDGRDVACSFQKAVVGEKHIYHIAKQWKEEQDKCLALQEYLGNERFLPVCYEQLISHPKEVLQTICTFIGATYSDDCLQYHRSGEAENTASSGAMWQNVKQQVLTDNFNKYKTQLALEDILLFERIAGHTLLALDYPVEYKEALVPYLFGACELEEYNCINVKLKQAARKNQTPAEAAKRENQEALLADLKSRLHGMYLRQKEESGIAV